MAIPSYALPGAGWSESMKGTKTSGTPDKVMHDNASESKVPDNSTYTQKDTYYNTGNLAAFYNGDTNPGIDRSASNSDQATYDDRMAAAMAGMADPATGDPLPGWYEKKQTTPTNPTGGNTAPDDVDLMDNTLWKAATPVGSGNSTPPWQPVTYNASDVIKDTFVNAIGREDGPTDDGLGYWLTQANANGWDAGTLQQAIINAAQKKPLPPPSPSSPAAYEQMNTDYSAPDQYRPSEADTVQGRLTGLLSQNNPYMKAARASGLATANARGLLNSSIAAQASQAAAINAALPIAQQDSSSFVNAGMAGYEGEIQGSLANQGYAIQNNLTGLQGDINANLARQQFGFDTQLADQGYGHDLGILAKQTESSAYLSNVDYQEALGLSAQDYQNKYNLSDKDFREALGLSEQEYNNMSGLSLQEFKQNLQMSDADFKEALQLGIQGFKIDSQLLDKKFNADRELGRLDSIYNQQLTTIEKEFAAKMQQIEIDAKAKLTAMDLASSESKTLSNQISSFGNTLLSTIALIESDPNLDTEAKKTIVAEINDIYELRLNDIMVPYGYVPTWGTQGG